MYKIVAVQKVLVSRFLCRSFTTFKKYIKVKKLYRQAGNVFNYFLIGVKCLI